MPLTFHLTVAGAAVTGTVEGLSTTPAEIHDGKIDGDMVTFWVNYRLPGADVQIAVQGKGLGCRGCDCVYFRD